MEKAIKIPVRRWSKDLERFKSIVKKAQGCLTREDAHFSFHMLPALTDIEYQDIFQTEGTNPWRSQ